MLNITRRPGESLEVGETNIHYKMLMNKPTGKSAILYVGDRKKVLHRGNWVHFNGFSLKLDNIQGKKITLMIDSLLKVRRSELEPFDA